jgi:hypothetical protein
MRLFTMMFAGLLATATLADAQDPAPAAPAPAPAAGTAPPQGGQGGRGGGAGRQGGPGGAAQNAPPAGPIKRMADGKPDLTGHFLGDAGGANYGLESRPGGFLLPPARGIVLDPPDGRLPYQDWARAEFISRGKPERGYDDPTAHCFVAGVPRSLWTPSPYQFIQPPGYLVMMFERMSWRVIPIDPTRKHLPDDVRLWQGDSIGHWEGDTLVIETRNLNGKAWLNEAGDVLSHAATVVERLTPINADRIEYRATITDPVAYTRPYTVGFNINRQPGEILEVACHEDNQDLEHLRHVKEDAIKNGTLK